MNNKAKLELLGYKKKDTGVANCALYIKNERIVLVRGEETIRQSDGNENIIIMKMGAYLICMFGERGFFVDSFGNKIEANKKYAFAESDKIWCCYSREEETFKVFNKYTQYKYTYKVEGINGEIHGISYIEDLDIITLNILREDRKVTKVIHTKTGFEFETTPWVETHGTGRMRRIDGRFVSYQGTLYGLGNSVWRGAKDTFKPEREDVEVLYNNVN